MTGILNIYLGGCIFAITLTVFAFVLARAGLITGKNSKRYAMLLSTLAAAGGLWLMENSTLRLERTVFDVLTLFFVLWFLCFFLFWTGVVFGVKKRSQSRGHGHDFGDSSILSMQFLESFIHPESQGVKASSFQETEALLATPSTQGEAKNQDRSSTTNDGVRIPVTRRNG